MKRIVWPCLLCILAGCSAQQAGSGDPATPSKKTDPLQVVSEKKKAVSGDEDAVNTVATVPVPEGGRPVAARVDAAGTIHLLYNSTAGPKYVKSSDNGKTFGAPI